MAVVRFGVFDLDLDTGDLHRLGRRVHLTAQTSKALTLLVSHAGDVVTREQIRDHLWSAGTFVDFDLSINFCISAARAALRDDARSPRFIETLPRRGYRFIAETAPVEREGHITIASPASPADWRKAGRWSIAIAATLLLATQQPQRPVAHTRTTASLDARAAFDLAFDAPPQDFTALRRSLVALKRATELDPRFAEAHYALGDLYLKLAMRRELPVAHALAEAESAARRAIALEDFPETHQLLANIRLQREWDWDGARRELAQAVALAPGWDIGLTSYARVLSAVGDDDAAIATIDRAESLSPSCDLILYDAAAIYARAGRFAEADQKLLRAIDLGPPQSLTLDRWRAEVQFRRVRFAVTRGDWQEARDAAGAVIRANGYNEDIQRRFAKQDARMAVEAFLRRSLDQLRAEAGNTYVAPTRLATFYALLGESDRAIDWLETAAAERDPDLIYSLRDPEFESLRGLARFAALERRIRRG